MKLSEAQTQVLASIEAGGFLTFNRTTGSVWGPSGRVRRPTFYALKLDCCIRKYGESANDEHYTISAGGRAVLSSQGETPSASAGDRA